MAWRALVSKRLHELRIVCCAEAPSSEPVRAYLRNNYATLKTLNPKFPFLVRAAEDKPYVVATYGMGHTETRDLDGLDEAAVERTFEELVALGEKHPRSAGRRRPAAGHRGRAGRGVGAGQRPKRRPEPSENGTAYHTPSTANRQTDAPCPDADDERLGNQRRNATGRHQKSEAGRGRARAAPRTTPVKPDKARPLLKLQTRDRSTPVTVALSARGRGAHQLTGRPRPASPRSGRASSPLLWRVALFRCQRRQPLATKATIGRRRCVEVRKEPRQMSYSGPRSSRNVVVSSGGSDFAVSPGHGTRATSLMKRRRHLTRRNFVVGTLNACATPM